ncbi:hypothetical protein [Cupriavidus necator]
MLNERKILLCMRGDGSGFAAVRHFVRSGRDEAIVKLPAPARNDARDYGCAATPQTVRLIRQLSPAGKVRVLIKGLEYLLGRSGTDSADTALVGREEGLVQPAVAMLDKNLAAPARAGTLGNLDDKAALLVLVMPCRTGRLV